MAHLNLGWNKFDKNTPMNILLFLLYNTDIHLGVINNVKQVPDYWMYIPPVPSMFFGLKLNEFNT